MSQSVASGGLLIEFAALQAASLVLVRYTDANTPFPLSTHFGIMTVSMVCRIPSCRCSRYDTQPHYPGLIRWKIVIHGFIDGKTRFIVGLKAHDNNRALTVLQFFQDIISVHGCPSRVRGDHGVENVGVAEFMEEKMGLDRGSYIWGR